MKKLVEISETCVLQNIRATSRHVTQIFESEFKSLGLTASQFSTLVAIGRQEGVSLTTVSEIIGMDRTTMKRVLTPLERRKLVRLAPSNEDGRTKALYLEPSGRDLLSQAIPYWQTAQTKVLSALSDENWHDLCMSLQKIKQR